MTPTYLNCDYGLQAVGLPWRSALNIELQRELVRGIPIQITKRYTWIGWGAWSNLQ